MTESLRTKKEPMVRVHVSGRFGSVDVPLSKAFKSFAAMCGAIEHEFRTHLLKFGTWNGDCEGVSVDMELTK